MRSNRKPGRGNHAPGCVMLMTYNTQKIRKGFFKKSLSVGYHNVRYAWVKVMLIILHCISGRESFEGGATEPSAQTLRDRLRLDGGWLEYFHQEMWNMAVYFVKLFSRLKWYISIDETYKPFFGNRKKLNKQLETEGLGRLVHGYRAKTPGAAGSFCFLVISLCCCKIRIPLFIKMLAEGNNYQDWLEDKLRRILRFVPNAIVLADRGFGKRAWFFAMLERLKAKYVVRVPLKKKESKNKVKSGAKSYEQWFGKGKNKVLLHVNVAKDEHKRVYFLANNLQGKTSLQILSTYLNRWDIENLFKDADRVELPTSSRNPQMRLFCVVLSFLLFALWQFDKVLERLGLSLRRFVKNCIDALCQSMRCIITASGKFLEIFNLKLES